VSFFKKLQERIIPIKRSSVVSVLKPDEKIKHEFVNFQTGFRIGIIAYFSNYAFQETISNYKKHLEKLGFDCEVLLYSDKGEPDHTIYLPSFNWVDLDKKTMLPHSPRTDRFIVKRYDILLNLYLNDCPQLLFISYMSYARCRVGPYLEHFKHCSDVLVPLRTGETVEDMIIKINNILNLKPYERKQI